MRIYDTLSGEKKELVQPKILGLFKRPIRMFVCGPTVYDHPHIGNARTFVFFDLFVRYLRSRGFVITYLQNITDVDDKIIQRAADEHTDWQTVAKRYETAFMDYNKRLGITSVDAFARSTEYIPEVITQVQTLISKGHVYKIDGDGWYFDLTTYAGYGQLAKRTVQQAEDGVTRIDASNKKRNAGDFCVWKLTPVVGRQSSVVSEPSWPSKELGDGRPGWHIEDTAITEKFFGPQYHIHGGALDLKFPHHEAERAQQESASGKQPFVQIWMHAGFLTINGQKMSKSLGNFMTVDDVLTKMTADEFRMMLVMHHYRQPLDFTEQTIAMAKDSLHYFRVRTQALRKKGSQKSAAIEKEFAEAMDDDFNTPRAIAALRRSDDSAFIESALAAVGITAYAPLPARVEELVQKRELSRASKQFAQSDALRKEIEQLGYVVEDTPQGPLVLPRT